MYITMMYHLVFPDYYPHRDDQPEDHLSPQIVQRGYKARAPIEVS
jgi:hypothetical protein